MSDSRELYAWLRKLGVASWSVVGTLILIGMVVWLLAQIKIILVPLVLAVGIVYLTNPLVEQLARWKIPRLIGAFAVYIILAGILTLLGFIAVPIIRDQITSFVTQIPDIADKLTFRIAELARSVGFMVDLPTLESIREWLSDPANREQIIGALGQISEAGLAVFEIAAVLILAPVLALYLLIDLPGLREKFTALVPEPSRPETIHVGSQLSKALGGFVRGQLVVALFVGVASSFGLWLIGHEFWLVIGILAGILNLVPFIGPIVGGILAFVTALVVQDFSTAIWSVVVFVAVQQVDNHFISPLVLRVTVKLHPVTIILALIAGGATGGFFGVLIAVPLVATIKILMGHVWRTRVLGQSWDEASEAMILEHEPPPEKSLVGRIRGGAEDAAPVADPATASSNPPDRSSDVGPESSQRAEPPEDVAAEG